MSQGTSQSATTGNRPRRRALWVAVALAALAVVLVVGRWTVYRFTHSITNDAFVDSHLINLAPQVSGTVIEVFVQEQDRVVKGQLLARIDPATYEREVELAAARLAVAEAALDKAQVALSLLTEEVPKRITIAEKKLAVSRDMRAQAGDSREMIGQDREQAVKAAQQAVAAAKATFVLGKEDFDRYSGLYQDGSVSERRFQEATRTYRASEAELRGAEAKLGQAEANLTQVPIADQALKSAERQLEEAETNVELAQLGYLEIQAGQKDVDQRERSVTEARRALELAETNLGYTAVRAPYDGVIARKWRHLGDYAHTGDPVFSMYNPDLLYVTTQLEETLLEGVAPGNFATLHVDAYAQPFRGRVLWIGSATSANFSLIPRDISSGEFTYVVQRIPTRIAIERDERWNLLRPGMSVTVAIEHGAGDADWARDALRQEAAAENLGQRIP